MSSLLHGMAWHGMAAMWGAVVTSSSGQGTGVGCMQGQHPSHPFPSLIPHPTSHTLCLARRQTCPVTIPHVKQRVALPFARLTHLAARLASGSDHPLLLSVPTSQTSITLSCSNNAPAAGAYQAYQLCDSQAHNQCLPMNNPASHLQPVKRLHGLRRIISTT